MLTLMPGRALGAPLIGYLYKIEGYLNGQRVVYVGSAATLKGRLVRKHKWSQLLGQKSTKVSYKKVYGELDIKASNQGTLGSARNEALRSVEQPELDKARKKVDRANRKRTPGQKRAKIGNKINASNTPHPWQVRHKVKVSRRWSVLRQPGAAGSPVVVLRAVGGVLLLVEAYRLYYDYKVSRFTMAPYLLEDENGVFTLDYKRSSWFANMRYFKNYVAGDKKGQKIRVSASEFRELADEARALWGTIDRDGDFVPGLLMPSLEVVVERA